MIDRNRNPNDDDGTEVETAARQFIVRYGEAAAEEASRRIAELAEAGDEAGVETWQLIKRTILRMLGTAPPGRSH